MNNNTTAILGYSPLGSYVSVGITCVSITVSTVICCMIITLTARVPSLRTPTNLLVANTCLCTLVFSGVSILDTFTFYLSANSTDWSCRIEGYLTSVSLTLVMYSYVGQSISRLFWTVFYKHRYLLTMRSHVYLSIGQICLSFLLPISILITKDIVFQPMRFCLVPLRYRLHVFYLLAVQYVIPVLTSIILYGIIYRFVSQSTSNSQRTSSKGNRDTKLARNILILLTIFMFGGIPSVLYIILSGQRPSTLGFFFFMAAAAPPVTVACEKLMTLVLNRDIRKVLQGRLFRYTAPSNRVQAAIPPVQP